MSISRRELLRWGTGAAALALSGVRPASLWARPLADKIPIGLQLYSVREDCAKDLPAVLEAVAKMGYQGVEFAGYYDRKAAELQKLLTKNELKCCGTHIQLDAFRGDELKKTIEFNKTIGNKYLIVAWMPPTYADSLDAVKAAAKEYNEIAAQVEGSRHGGWLPCARWGLQEDRRRIRLGPVLRQYIPRRFDADGHRQLPGSRW